MERLVAMSATGIERPRRRTYLGPSKQNSNVYRLDFIETYSLSRYGELPETCNYCSLKPGDRWYMCNNASPYWGDWKEVFGMDRASGSWSVPTHGEGLPEGFLPDNIEETKPNNETSTSKSTKKSGKKRKIDDQLDRVMDLMNRMHDDTTQQWKNL
ncbi:hypothetical protein SASPL_111840 [Salvia splendens]|uniref:Uncharacterized protein n=1 Tax=Salvia splendens TaxID=180675 RepID=A0A8X8Y9N9_SALSN|nr:hypothetical protein SASPL_111840 [Salvia splendens]